ncbi:MAG: redox-regulated ATPase YchF [Puniceicoccales bacterium]|jgi:GTP-binding protein YchF|nr:redox-regulated ATPase YchF [Puniceicoccales bacterium]
MKVGIVGLPNVGKSTLFNALTRTRKAEARNYPFCTIEPNVGVVEVPDERLQVLREMFCPSAVVPTTIEFVDIAGLVPGANRGEGLGNKFLARIREMDIVVLVVRCFDSDNIIHIPGPVDALRDLEIIQTEFILADLESAQSQLERNRRKAKGQDKEAVQLCDMCERLLEHFNEGFPARTLPIASEEAILLHRLFLLSAKPVIYACNVAEHELADASSNLHVKKVYDYARDHPPSDACIVSASAEEELGQLPSEEAGQYLAELGVMDSGVSDLIRKSYRLLNLASFFTAGEKEVRAWTFRKGMKASQCAGVIHGDFEKGFIKAEVVAFEDLKKFGNSHEARAAGKYRLEGKDYVFTDGDVVVFRFA